MVKKRVIFILISFVSILTWIVTPSSALAQSVDCKTNNDNTCLNPGYLISCSFTSTGGVNTKACCSSSAECSKFRTQMTTGGSVLNGGVKSGTGVRAWNPECKSGGEGIDTALGCLPYKSEDGKFTNSLLTFLAGITGAISLVVMLMATIQIMTAGGNPEQVKKGKELLTGAITGLLFIIFSVTLLRLIAGDIIQLEGF